MAEMYQYNPKGYNNVRRTGKAARFADQYKVEKKTTKKKISKEKSVKRKIQRYMKIGGIALSTLLAAYGVNKLSNYIEDINKPINIEMSDEKLAEILENYINKDEISNEDMIYIKSNMDLAIDEVLNPLEEQIVSGLAEQGEDFRITAQFEKGIMGKEAEEHYYISVLSDNQFPVKLRTKGMDMKNVIEAGANLEELRELNKKEISSISDQKLIERYLENAEKIMRETDNKEIEIETKDDLLEIYEASLEEVQKDKKQDEQAKQEGKVEIDDDEMEI